ncbi:lactonase family protein [Tundrisphaera lichenicola]|uniref:lactonase family protein n=1 Tax=Tundrisphaera lichenicola TaxID=2029860 RepID=UPI003EBDC6CE
MSRIALIALLSLASVSPAWAQETPKTRVYIGTYTAPNKSKGIYLLELDPETGALVSKGVAAETTSPSFLALHPNGRYLYAANEVDQFAGKKAGAVTGFEVDPKTGTLKTLNARTSGGTGPCYVTVDPTGSVVLVANYGGGSLEALPIQDGGKLGEPTSFIQHKGSSVIKGRQSSPHAHSIDLDVSGKLAVASDLGLDKLMIYRLDPKSGTLAPNVPPYEEMAPGSGPRHFAFHPDGRHAYVINEIDCTVTVLDFDTTRGALSRIQTISTRKPDAPKNNNSTAEILVHPSGRFVYGSNRGDNTLAIYSVEPASGKLTLVGFQPTGGKTPRSFGIDPTGRFVLAANQDSDTVVVFKVDAQTGQLQQVGDPVQVPSPVCVKFVPAGE